MESFITNFWSKVDLMLNSYIYNGYTALSGALAPVFVACASLYIIMLGIYVMKGSVELSTKEVIQRAVLIGLVYLGVTSWGFVSYYINDAINSLANGMSQAVAGFSPHSSISGGGGGINGALQALMSQFTSLGSYLFSTGGMTNISGYLEGIVIFILGYVVIAVSIFEILLCKMSLAVLITLTPLFVIFALFEQSRKWFYNWMGYLAGFCFGIFFVSMVLVLIINVVAIGTSYVIADGGVISGTGFSDLVPTIICAIIGIFLIFSMTKVALSIGGGMGSSPTGVAMMALAGGFIGSTIGKGTSLYNKGKGMMPKGSGSGGSGLSETLDAAKSDQLQSLDPSKGK